MLLPLFAFALLAGSQLAVAAACPVTPVRVDGDRPVIGLVLSGGGARGAAHLGALRVIEEAGIPVDLVVGTSMGSIVGGLYASGLSVDAIDRVVRDNDWNAVLGDGPPYVEQAIARKREMRAFHLGGRLGIDADGVRLPPGMRAGQNIRLLLRDLTRHVADEDCFRNLALPFAAVATDVETGEAVVLDHGDIVDALRASMAIPAYFTPVEIEGRLLVDGGSANNMPVSLARSMGADIVIAIDIGTPLASRDRLQSLFDISLQATTMLARRAVDEERRRLGAGDLLIVPDLAGISTLDFGKMPQAVVAGEDAARAALADYPWRDRLPREQLPSVRFAGRTAALGLPATLAALHLDGDAFLPPEQVTGRFQLRPGDAFDSRALHAAITRVYGLDYFSTIDYRRRATERGDEITLRLARRSTGPTYLQFGLGLYDNFEGLNRFSLGASLTATEINRFTGQFNVQARLGSSQRLFAELYQPVTGGGHLFVAPWALYDRHHSDIYLGSDPFARVRAGSEELGLDAGWAARRSEWRLGYGRGTRRMQVFIGPPSIPAFASHVGYLRFSGEYDDQDARDFPARGIHLEWLAEHGSTGLGSDDDFQRTRVRGDIAMTAGEQYFVLAVAGESLNTHASLALEQAQTGGPLELSAFAYGELAGDNAGMLRISTYRRANRLPFLKLFVGGGLEYGGAWNGSPSAVDFDQLWPVATVFAGLSTPIGPILLVGGLSENDRKAVQFQLGYRF